MAIDVRILFKSPDFKMKYMKLMRDDSNKEIQGFITDELIACANDDATRRDAQKEASSKGGIEAAKVKKESLKDRNGRIAKQARALLENGREKANLAAILASQYKLSPRHIRGILKEAGFKKTEM